MNKDKLLAALYSFQNNDTEGNFFDEIETLITLIVNISDDEIETAWNDYQSDK